MDIECPFDEQELVLAYEDLLRTRASRTFKLPPIIPSDRAFTRKECRQCEAKKRVCGAVGQGGFVGCFASFALLPGPAGAALCNALTLPSGFGCIGVMKYCYMKNCGL